MRNRSANGAIIGVRVRRAALWNSVFKGEGKPRSMTSNKAYLHNREQTIRNFIHRRLNGCF
jgi:hypothetical protein